MCSVSKCRSEWLQGQHSHSAACRRVYSRCSLNSFKSEWVWAHSFSFLKKQDRYTKLPGCTEGSRVCKSGDLGGGLAETFSSVCWEWAKTQTINSCWTPTRAPTKLLLAPLLTEETGSGRWNKQPRGTCLMSTAEPGFQGRSAWLSPCLRNFTWHFWNQEWKLHISMLDF